MDEPRLMGSGCSKESNWYKVPEPMEEQGIFSSWCPQKVKEATSKTRFRKASRLSSSIDESILQSFFVFY